MDIVCGVKDGVLDVLIDEAFTSFYRDRAKSQNDCQEHDYRQYAFVIHFFNFLSGLSLAFIL